MSSLEKVRVHASEIRLGLFSTYHIPQVGLHRGLLVRRPWWQYRLRHPFSFTLCKFLVWASLVVHPTTIYWMAHLCLVLNSPGTNTCHIRHELCFHYLYPILQAHPPYLIPAGWVWWGPCGGVLPHSLLVTSSTWSHELFHVFSRSSNSFISLWTCLHLSHTKTNKNLKLIP